MRLKSPSISSLLRKTASACFARVSTLPSWKKSELKAMLNKGWEFLLRVRPPSPFAFARPSPQPREGWWHELQEISEFFDRFLSKKRCRPSSMTSEFKLRSFAWRRSVDFKPNGRFEFPGSSGDGSVSGMTGSGTMMSRSEATAPITWRPISAEVRTLGLRANWSIA